MAETPYITIRLGGESMDLPQASDLPIAINYEIEDEDDFRQKKSGSSLNITVPATTSNSKILNTIYNIGAEDLLPNEGFDKPQDVVIIGAGNELMKGKAFVLAGRNQYGKPKEFDINCFGDNADWVIPNKELTLHDILNTNTHTFNKANIESSWLHDGTNENEDYVYAPARNREAFGIDGDIPDEVFRIINARPSLFLYWLLYRGFKAAGYKIESLFFDTNYFRRMVLPWTWGNFFYLSEKIIKEMGFCATGHFSTTKTMPFIYMLGGTKYNWYCMSVDGGVSKDEYAWYTPLSDDEPNFLIDNVSTDIGYIGNALSYNFDTLNGYMSWEYLNTWASLGIITVGLEIKLSARLYAGYGSFSEVKIIVYKNMTPILPLTHTMFEAFSPYLGVKEDKGTRTYNFEVTDVNPTDIISVRVYCKADSTLLGFARIAIVLTGDGVGNIEPDWADIRSYLKLTYVKRQTGTNIRWQDFDKFKNFKWLDLLRGTIDTFNLQMNTDPVTKTVTIEPTHDYSLNNNLGVKTGAGYYNGNALDWSQKEDISKVSEISIFQDYEKEVDIKFKSDNNDGILKLLEDRNQTDVSKVRYVFPERFKKGSKQIENRFFSSVVHYEHLAWKVITNISPQLICLIPENIANTSNIESEYTFSPKLAWYAGMKDKDVYGGWNWDGDKTKDLPYMFAVDYKPGGENHPILTYCDQRIDDGGGGFKKGFGLFKRFFWQRFAIMRHGKRLKSNFNLNNTDVVNRKFREYITINSQRYQLLKISNFKPLLNETTECEMWRFYPITEQDAENTYPSEQSVMDGELEANSPDIRYVQLICLPTDIPK